LCEDPDYPLDFSECLNILRAGDSVEVKCPACAKNTEFISHHYFKSTPKYLMLIPNRFIIKNFMQRKLNAIINMPEQLDINEFLISNSKSTGPLLKEEKKKKYS
jgi:ubiquitin carboxyl-terminal hydrolase 5/13